jgi:hypothetical protein
VSASPPQIEGALLVMDDCDIDRPLGNPHAGEDTVKPCHNFGTRTTAERDYSSFVGVLKDGPVGRINTGHSPRSGRNRSGSSTASSTTTTPTAQATGSVKVAEAVSAGAAASESGVGEVPVGTVEVSPPGEVTSTAASDAAVTAD